MKFGVRECVDVVFKALSAQKIGSHTFQAGEPVVYFDTLTTSNLESSATTTYAQGGRGNARLMAWEGEKTMTFTMTNALISPEGIAILSGADLIRANGKDESTFVKAHHTVTFEVTAENYTTGKLTIPAGEPIPVNDPDLPAYVMILDNNSEMSGIAAKAKEVSSENGSITLEPADLLKVGDIVTVDYYSVHKADAIQIDITPDQFAGYYYIEGSTLFRRQSDGYDLPAEIIIPRGKIQSNFTFTFASTGDPSTFDFTVDAFPGYVKGNKAKQVLATIQILDADDNYDLTSGNETGTIEYERYEYNQDGGAYIGIKEEGPVTKSTATADKTTAAGSDDPEAAWA